MPKSSTNGGGIKVAESGLGGEGRRDFCRYDETMHLQLVQVSPGI